MTAPLPRHELGFLTVGGPTVVIDVAGLRLVSDPTFDAPTDYGALRKTRGPAVTTAALADTDVVLVSHADHADNLDVAGRAFALAAPRLLTNPGSARLLGGPAEGLAPWEAVRVSDAATITAVPARHGPADGETDAAGYVNCEVTGFVIQAPGTTIYVSGDNTSLALVAQVKERFGKIDHAVLHAGRATVPAKFAGRPLSLSAERASAAAQLLAAGHVVVAHQTGWEHFVDGPGATHKAFHDAGIADCLDSTPEGEWSVVG
ncbi:MBL fold metallo-hydrolase [Actinomyces sp. MRS3W]|uniref:MBL fold metallo-hydrolase n=1 Tax=Actinomyces sp. MRS3W TaxID=2800796 RepID=UPI0028FDBA73|nr:MBL fold metallo-hydrolase [Actinomyces sp. MRS3W]MDU0349612.1 MBL fold metallo-hydrolase [Actinomyces sp. MRS3W]